jgi:hypothetical protein
MLKLTVGMLALAVATSASAAGWRSMRIDASSEASFNASVTALKEKLPAVRKAVFERSLNDIWVKGTQAAQEAEREYTVSDYLRQVDGLAYKEVVRFTDPSGDTADRYFDAAYASLFGRRAAPPTGGFAPPSGGVSTFSGSKILDAGQSARAEGRMGGNHF